MRTKLDEWKAMGEEVKICMELLSVWIILKDGKQKGRITVRHTRTGKATTVTLEMYQGTTCEGQIEGYRKKTGSPASCEARAVEAVTELIQSNEEKLKVYYRMRLYPSGAYRSMNDIAGMLEFSGYTVIRAI